MRLLVVFLSVLLFVACAPSEQVEVATEVDTSAADIQAINQAAQEWVNAFKAADASALASIYSNDAALLPPNESTVTGRAALQTWNQSFFDQFTMEAVNLSTDELVVAGDWAYRIGSYEMTMKPTESDPVEDAGKFIEIWTRQADGSWKISHDIWNSNNPLPGAGEQ